MRSTATWTLMVLVAALAAAGCSNSDEAPQAQAVQPVNTSFADRTGSAPSTAGPVEPPLPVGPASFADGEAAYHAADYAQARRVFTQYTSEKPDNAWGHYMLGLSAWKDGDPATAETAFEAALMLDPKHGRSLVNLSRVLIEQGRFDDAIVKLTDAVEIESRSAELNRLFGRAYHGLGMIDDAAAAYRGAIALDNEDVWSMNNLGFLYLGQGRPYDALPPLARAVELRKDIATFHNNLGMALEHTGRFTAAAAVYGAALEADPAYERALSNLMRVQAVKVNAEEPFELEATAKRFAEESAIVEATKAGEPQVEEPELPAAGPVATN